MKNLCEAYQEGVVSCYPIKSKKAKPVADKYRVLILQKDDCYWMEKRPEDGLLAGLWAFPLITEDLWRNISVKLDAAKALKPVKHVFTHRRWELSPFIIKPPNESLFQALGIDASQGRYVTKDEMERLAIPTAFRKVVDQL